jgi:hypothetical protein
MMIVFNRANAVAALVCSAAITSGAMLAWPARAVTPAGELASHRAIYELTLARSQRNSSNSMAAARGRILYDFAGSACEGYKLEFRQVSELDNGEGRVTLSDLRSNTWEDAEGKTYQFTSQNYTNNRLVDSVDGRATRDPAQISVTLTKPKDERLDLDRTVVFPTEHVKRILEAAHAGKSILQFPVYDGSESGEKVYNTLTIVGRMIPPDGKAPTDAAAGQQALAGLSRWPVTVSYFDRTAPAGEQTPAYSISFELYENGISRALLLDYNDFAISGELTSLEVRDTKPCQ